MIIEDLNKFGIIDQENDFWEEYSDSISGEELRQNMHKNIDTWLWNEAQRTRIYNEK